MGPSLQAQRDPAAQESSPQATVNGRTWTQRELFQRNIGAPEDQTTQFPPHKVIGNIYYVGTRSLASFLVAVCVFATADWFDADNPIRTLIPPLSSSCRGPC
jgi:hypothetical protein